LIFSAVSEGFALGLDRAGMKTVVFCEIEEYPRSKLKKHWPDVPIALDIRKLSYNFKTKQLWYKARVIYVGSIELICGGFPCQPFSVAGKQAGKEDDRHLWPEMFRLIQEIRPHWVIGENVAGFISIALDDVLFNLESEEYETQTFVIPACAVGGIHRRDRVWIIANSMCRREWAPKTVNKSTCNKNRNNQTSREERRTIAGKIRRNDDNATDSEYGRWNKRGKQTGRKKRYEANRYDRKVRCGLEKCTKKFTPIKPPTQSPVRHRDDGLPDNVARLKALGNAVVPKIPELIGRAIMEIERMK